MRVRLDITYISNGRAQRAPTGYKLNSTMCRGASRSARTIAKSQFITQKGRRFFCDLFYQFLFLFRTISMAFATVWTSYAFVSLLLLFSNINKHRNCDCNQNYNNNNVFNHNSPHYFALTLLFFALCDKITMIVTNAITNKSPSKAAIALRVSGEAINVPTV